MLILPAIDIRRGNCVRLYQGREDQETVYSHDPIAMGQLWKDKGAKILHVADLDGAFEGKPVNLPLVARMRKEVGLPIELGGGYRDMESIDRAHDAGIERVILGTVAVYNPDLVRDAVQKYGSFVSVSIDVTNDMVAVAGWKQVSEVRSDDLAKRMRELGVAELLFTDTRKDGTLSGPNVEKIGNFLKAAQLPVIISGGISSADDIRSLRPLEIQGLKGVVIGKALYDHRIKLEDALAAGAA